MCPEEEEDVASEQMSRVRFQQQAINKETEVNNSDVLQLLRHQIE